MGREVACSRLDCSRQVVTKLEERDYCFDHFCARCYEFLERSDRTGDLEVSAEDLRKKQAALDECAKRVLEVSLSEASLNNLDRARLLDILLWAGDLGSTLRHRRMAASNRSRLRGTALARR